MAKTEKMESLETKANEKTAYNPWKDMREVFLERGAASEPKSLYFCVDGHDYMIPRGKKVSVPAPIAKQVDIYKQATAALMNRMVEIEAESQA